MKLEFYLCAVTVSNPNRLTQKPYDNNNDCIKTKVCHFQVTKEQKKGKKQRMCLVFSVIFNNDTAYCTSSITFHF